MDTNISKRWVWLMIAGIVLIILGILAISAAPVATLVSVLFLGSLLAIAGVFFLIDSFRHWGQWKEFFFRFVLAVLYLAAGVWLFFFPVAAAVGLTLILGIFYLVVGIFRALNALSLRYPHWGWSLFSGVVALLLGVLILAHWPMSSLFIIGLFVGIDLLFVGWFYILASMAAKKGTVNFTTPI